MGKSIRNPFSNEHQQGCFDTVHTLQGMCQSDSVRLSFATAPGAKNRKLAESKEGLNGTTRVKSKDIEQALRMFSFDSHNSKIMRKCNLPCRSVCRPDTFDTIDTIDGVLKLQASSFRPPH
jgi:hypothetical protein